MGSIKIASRALIHRIARLVEETTSRVLVHTGPQGVSLTFESYAMTGSLPISEEPSAPGCRVLPDLVITAAADHVDQGGSATLEIDMAEGIVDVGLGNRGFIEPMAEALPSAGSWDIVQVKTGMPVLAGDDFIAGLGEFPGYLVMSDRSGVSFRGLGRSTVERDRILPTAHLEGRGLKVSRVVVDGPSLRAAFASTADSASPQWATVVQGHAGPVVGVVSGSLAFALAAGAPLGVNVSE